MRIIKSFIGLFLGMNNREAVKFHSSEKDVGLLQ